MLAHNLCHREGDLWKKGQPDQIFKGTVLCVCQTTVWCVYQTAIWWGYQTKLESSVLQNAVWCPTKLHLCYQHAVWGVLPNCRQVCLYQNHSGVPNNSLMCLPNSSLELVPNNILVFLPNCSLELVPNNSLVCLPNLQSGVLPSSHEHHTESFLCSLLLSCRESQKCDRNQWTTY